MRSIILFLRLAWVVTCESLFHPLSMSFISVDDEGKIAVRRKPYFVRSSEPVTEQVAS